MRSEEVGLTCEALQELQTSRKFLISLRVKQTNACGALVRRGFGFHPKMSEEDRKKTKERARALASAFLAGKPVNAEDASLVETYAADLNCAALALAPLLKREAEVVKDMEKLARKLPVHAWAQQVKGFGDRALAVVIGETGDLSKYPNFRHIWKRLGLAPFEGLAASNWKRYDRGRPRTLTDQEWTDLGYRASRRAEIHALIADPMSKHQLISAEKSGTEFGAPKGKYGSVYVDRREHTKVTHPDWTKGHSRDDALRIMTQRLISDLWSEWRGSSKCLHATIVMAPAELIAAE